MIFNTLLPSIVFQEVPGEISLCFSITGCDIGCNGCHSTELWKKENGTFLNEETFEYWLNKYQNLISCVVFFGGEWQPSQLISLLCIAQSRGLKTCLYTGRKYIDLSISHHLDFLKTGKWDAALGGLDSDTTNQVFMNVKTGETLNHLFNSQGVQHAAA
ncbi:anaerobic ribonucleoside-triphosphate reductase activating protein [Thalassotalea atypica]|uniref:anaerobic ribonucleoside-triphosphate reductase activating protein n=1 Tax=Thalassotalea atypica TaxID=2054316 RepID=UPI0025728DD0|nr:anaerobic ribonucleoside-triphosphate reductase activating protein [Thalassotalea atypica]